MLRSSSPNDYHNLSKQIDFSDLSDDEEYMFSLDVIEERMTKKIMVSPCHTRSGQVYTEEVSRRIQGVGRGSKSLQGGGDSLDQAEDAGNFADNEENDENIDFKIHSAFSKPRVKRYPLEIPSSPVLSSHFLNEMSSTRPTRRFVSSNSPPVCTADKSLNLLESPNTACSSQFPPTVISSLPRSKSRLLFSDEMDFQSSSLPLVNRMSCVKVPLLEANVNPFTPDAMSRSRLTVSSQSSESDSREDDGYQRPQAKKIRVSDINVSRYNEEFLELAQIATGQFGIVKKARHRLDGVVYAVKISKKKLRPNSRDENLGLNEVFAQAAMMKHKHIVRYFNSWAEVFCEFCEGGSLESKLEECRIGGIFFKESEVKKLLLHVAKGLNYIHSKQLAHLDIKPGNILISLNEDEMSALRPGVGSQSPDSGAVSGDNEEDRREMIGAFSARTGRMVQYKIGDLGHVVAVMSNSPPEEGDCRYMAPEFLQMEVLSGPRLYKADLFSTGMTAYETASLQNLPRNSFDDNAYALFKRGELPLLPSYSQDLHYLIRSLVHPDPSRRPTASRLLSDSLLNPLASKSKVQLKLELKQTKEKLLALEEQLDNVTNPSVRELKLVGRRKVGRGTARSCSSFL